MTVQNCIEYVDGIEPNAYTAAQKASWISECEGRVYTGLFLVQPCEFVPVAQSDSRVLALPAPYDRLYPRYLQAMIHYANGEYDRYANSMAVFNEAWGEANRWFGGDFDVTDRLRNRRFTVDISPELGEQALLTVPAGCAVAAGRLVTERAFALSADSTVQAWFGTPSDPVGPTVSLAQSGSTPFPLLIGEGEGTTLGVTLGPGAWTAAGKLILTGYLLVGREEYVRRGRAEPWRS